MKEKQEKENSGEEKGGKQFKRLECRSERETDVKERKETRRENKAGKDISGALYSTRLPASIFAIALYYTVSVRITSLRLPFRFLVPHFFLFCPSLLPSSYCRFCLALYLYIAGSCIVYYPSFVTPWTVTSVSVCWFCLFCLVCSHISSPASFSCRIFLSTLLTLIYLHNWNL